MLILLRRTGERLKIGDEATVRIEWVNAHQVRLGIEAPRDIPAHRS